MEKIIYSIFATLLISISANAQISFDDVGTKNTVPKYIGQTKIGNSVITENTSGQVVVPYLAVGTSSVDALYVYKSVGQNLFKAYDNGGESSTTVIKAEDKDGVQKFKLMSDGAIYTGTLQGVSTSTFVAGSNTITVTNGIITNVQ